MGSVAFITNFFGGYYFTSLTSFFVSIFTILGLLDTYVAVLDLRRAAYVAVGARDLFSP